MCGVGLITWVMVALFAPKLEWSQAGIDHTVGREQTIKNALQGRDMRQEGCECSFRVSVSGPEWVSAHVGEDAEGFFVEARLWDIDESVASGQHKAQISVWNDYGTAHFILDIEVKP